MYKTTLLFLALLLTSCGTKAPEQTSAKPEVQPTAADNSVGSISRLDPALDELIPTLAKIEKLADGFTFVEGPLWFPEGHLWFSDVVGNVVRQWTPGGTVTEILRPGGGENKDAPPGSFIGPNGMVHTKDGAVLLCQHSNRRIAIISKDRQVSSFLDKFQGK